MFQLLLAIIYLAFISLGLPDGLLGAAWPSIYKGFAVPVSFAGIISMIIALGTIVSSLNSNRITKKIGTGKVTGFSVLLTAVALFGFSTSTNFIMMCLWAIPYGLGAGSVDAALNNYVALHYKSSHMSWLHCMWGVGASIGPYVIGYTLSDKGSWTLGYRYIGLLQIILTVILFISLPLWKKMDSANKNGKETDLNEDTNNVNIENSSLKVDYSDTRKNELNFENDSVNINYSGNKQNDLKIEESNNLSSNSNKVLSLKEIISIQGVKEVMLAFFCYCAIEQTAGLWASSYLVLHRGISVSLAANFASFFFIGITVGRGVNGFLTFKFNDTQLIRIGEGIILIGIIMMLLPFGSIVSLVGLIFIGLGCAPIYPCIIHSTPTNFGETHSGAIIGVQMASAYVGTCLMPPIFGLIANYINVALLPMFLFVILVLMFITYEMLLKKVK